MHHAFIEWDDGWFTLIFALGLGVGLTGLVFGCYGLYRLRQRMQRNRT